MRPNVAMRVSYAQNAEDIVLSRAFADQNSGFYIDVGAADPRADSVTKLFYDRGWSGVNVEPQFAHWRDLMRERQRDVNLRCAVGARRGRGRFVHNKDIPGWSTMSDDFATRYRDSGMALDVFEIDVTTLADVFREHAPSVIDFLKIDVEGFEREVLVGNDWVAYRPRVVVIEATEPESWEGILSAARYEQTLFDGINRFYVREEDPELVEHLSAPPNVLDDYVSWIHADRMAALANRVSELEAEVVRLRGRASTATASPSGTAKDALHETLVETADTARKPLSTKWKRHRSTGRTGAPPRDSISAVNRNEPVPLPPLELIMRVGARPEDPLGSYLEIGRSMMAHVRRLLPDERPLENARFLDFGCGAGRTLRLLLDIPGISLTGCDIHEESIKWVRQHMPQVNAFVNDELPPLPIPDRSIDIVWAGSVFTHLDETWSAWILEMHRILDRGGVLVASFLASGMSETIAHEPWDENRIGMNTLMRGNPWDEGGPSILLSPWWIREHWGRAFEVLTLEPEGFGSHGAAVLRKREVTVARKDLGLLSDDPRELIALQHHVEQLHKESMRFRGVLDPAEAKSRGDAGVELASARSSILALRAEVDLMRSSRSWRMTRPLRALSSRARSYLR